MKIDTKKLAEYSTIENGYTMIVELFYREFYRSSHIRGYYQKTIESMFDTMKRWTPGQVDEIFDENGDLNEQAISRSSEPIGANRFRTPEDSLYKRVVLVQLCRWLVSEAISGAFNEKRIFNLKDTMIAYHSGFAGSYEIPTDLVKLAEDFVSKEFILNAFDSETCWIEFE